MLEKFHCDRQSSTYKSKVLILASCSHSHPNFRGALIEALCATGYEVHCTAPGLHPYPANSCGLVRLRAGPVAWRHGADDLHPVSAAPAQDVGRRQKVFERL